AFTPASARLPSGGQVPATNAAPVQPGMGGMEGINTLTPCLPWEVVSSPNVGTSDNQLRGVAAVSANDVWAVGDYSNGTGHQQTLVEHWNGTAWSVVPSPNVGTGHNVLNGVAAVSANDVWAVGTYETFPN